MTYYKKCDADHYYTSSLSSCPVCAAMGEPPPTVRAKDGMPTAEDSARTRVAGTGAPAFGGDTVRVSGDSSDPSRTQTMSTGGTAPTQVASGPGQTDPASVRTIVIRGSDGTDEQTIINQPQSEEQNNPMRDDQGDIIVQQDSSQTVVLRKSPGDSKLPPVKGSDRILGGWLITYTWNKQGTDFRLYEGRNVVGRSADAQIRIPEDASISSIHAAIILRDGKFTLKEEGPSNPIRINGVEVDMGAFVKLNDGDILEFGKTKLLLRSALHN